MAKFDFEEEKVINALHPEKAEVGKKYWFADSITYLKECVESGINNIFVLEDIINGNHPFYGSNNIRQFLYPYEEPPKKRMSNRQLAEWLMKGNGEYIDEVIPRYSYANYIYEIENTNKEVADVVKIRTWDSEDWVEPTVDVYERDCKGGKE